MPGLKTYIKGPGCFALVLLLATSVAVGHGVITTKLTWSREVSRIFFRRCIQCHREGATAFPLTDYDSARPWAQAIKEEVLARRMPPWFAVKGFGEFKHDGGLSQEEIEIISHWVEGGAPKGDERLLPALPRSFPQPLDRPLRIARTIALHGEITLKRAATFTAIRPAEVAAGQSIKVIAERPDGSLVPLIWLYDYNPKFARTYLFAAEVSLPQGTKIQVQPAGSTAKLVLVTSALKPGS